VEVCEVTSVKDSFGGVVLRTGGKPVSRRDLEAWKELAREWGADISPHDETQISFTHNRDAESFYNDLERELPHLVLRTGYSDRSGRYMYLRMR